MNKNKASGILKNIWDRLGVWLIAILLFAVMSVASGKFLTANNLINVIRQVAVTGIVALGATFVVTSGEIDLSQGGVVCLSGCVCAYMMMRMGINPWVSTIITVIISTIAMSLIGCIITFLNVPSFIATLGFN